MRQIKVFFEPIPRRSSPDHTASFPPTTPACYACTLAMLWTDPGSTAPTHAYSWDPVASGIYMYTSCFLNFTAWVETQTNLRDILHAWLLCSRRAHSLRSMRALKCVHRWQREKWMECANTMRTRSCCRRPFTLWAREFIPLPLIDSSSEDNPLPLIDSDSSSSSEDWPLRRVLVQTVSHQNIELKGVYTRASGI